MNSKGHFKYYFISMIPWTIFIITCSIINMLDLHIDCTMPIKWYFLPAFYLAFFLINPDIDLLWGIRHHRSIVTHSVLYPVAIYWAFHSFLVMDDILTKVFGLIIFFPVFVHLLCDYKMNDVIDDDKGKGSWRISTHFWGRLSKKNSIAWVSLNELSIIIYTLYLWGLFDVIFT